MNETKKLEEGKYKKLNSFILYFHIIIKIEKNNNLKELWKEKIRIRNFNKDIIIIAIEY